MQYVIIFVGFGNAVRCKKWLKAIIDFFFFFGVTFTDSCSTLLSISIFDLELHSRSSLATLPLVHIRLSITHYLQFIFELHCVI